MTQALIAVIVREYRKKNKNGRAERWVFELSNSTYLLTLRSLGLDHEINGAGESNRLSYSGFL